MNNGDSFAMDFEPDELIIDTGISNKSNLTTAPIVSVIDIPEKYVPIYAEIEVQTITTDATLSIIDKDDNRLFEQTLDKDNLFCCSAKLSLWPFFLFLILGNSNIQLIIVVMKISHLD